MFCLAGLKKLVGETFCAVNPKTFGCEKFIYKSRGRVSRLPVGIYFLHSADKIIGETFSVSLISDIENIL